MKKSRPAAAAPVALDRRRAQPKRRRAVQSSAAKPAPRRAAARTAATAPVVLITGASQGIGAAIARAFAAAIPGVRLALVARQAGKLAGVARECATLGAEARPFDGDVSSASDVARVATEVHALWKKVDVLVNNAGASVRDASWRRQWPNSTR